MTTINTPNGSAPERPRLSAEDRAYLDKAFTYHPPIDEPQLDRYATVRAGLRDAAMTVLLVSPPSRERSLALTKLEEAMFWANASIARSGGGQ